MAKKEWEHRALGEVKIGKAVIWRAQISTAPDGKELAGIRKFIVKADGTEIVGKDGFSVLYEDAPDVIPQLKELLDLLMGGKVKVKTKEKAKEVAKLEGDYVWYLKNEDDEYFKRPDTFVESRAKAKAFLTKEEAAATMEAQDLESTCRVIKVKAA